VRRQGIAEAAPAGRISLDRRIASLPDIVCDPPRS
jgi:hypothetical protein